MFAGAESSLMSINFNAFSLPLCLVFIFVFPWYKLRIHEIQLTYT